ncbi:MAG: hypothetical protein V4650_07040 [Pseudomonadota bacterium]
MNTKLVLRASLLAISATLLPACSDVLDSPEDSLPPPVDLANPTPSPAPAPVPAPAPAPVPAPVPTSSIPTKAQLYGSWRQVRENGVAATSTITISFFSDNTYVEGGEQNTADCNPTPANIGTNANYDGNGNGYEFGEYLYTESSGQILASSTKFFLDTNGDCGLHEASTGATQDTFNATLTGDVLRLSDAASTDFFEFERVQRGAGVVGSWYAIDNTDGDTTGADPGIISLFADGRFVLLCDEPEEGASTATNPFPDSPGTQVGRYSIDAANNLTVSNVTTNTTSCSIGPTRGDGSATGVTNERLFVNAAGQLVYSSMESGVPFSTTLAALPLTPRFDPTLVRGTWFYDENDDGLFIGAAETLGAGDALLAYFGADGKFIFGGAGTDEACETDYNGSGVAVEPAGNGYEVGSFTVDATTGRLALTINSETDGSCGTFDRNRPEQRSYLLGNPSSGRMALQIRDRNGDGDQAVVFRSVPSSSNSLFGGWRGTTSAAGTAADDVLVAYFDDSTAGPNSGIYLAVDANPGSTCSLADPGPRGGIQLGQYLFNGSTIDYTTSNDPATGFSLRTLCQTRFDPNGTQTISFLPDFLTYTDNQASTPAASYVYNKLTRP